MISKAVAGNYVESKIQSYSIRKYGRVAFLVIISNHEGDNKYQAIVKSRSNIIQNIKCNVRNFHLEQHVLNHRTAIYNLRDCATHIGNLSLILLKGWDLN